MNWREVSERYWTDEASENGITLEETAAGYKVCTFDIGSVRFREYEYEFPELPIAEAFIKGYIAKDTETPDLS